MSSNKQVVLKEYVNGFPKETNMCIRTSSVKLKVEEGSKTILVKNLYLSCDPSMRSRMMKLEGSYAQSFKPGSVKLTINFFLCYFLLCYIVKHSDFVKARNVLTSQHFMSVLILLCFDKVQYFKTNTEIFCIHLKVYIPSSIQIISVTFLLYTF